MRIVMFGLLFVSQLAAAGSDGMHKPSIPKDFAFFSQLIGSWKGVSEMDGKRLSMSVTYKQTSGGTAVTETLMEGSEQEMITVYHKDGDGVAMTHYCALGNQPHMKLKKAGADHMQFEMTKPTGIASAKEPHMHAVTLKLVDQNTLEQHWVHYADGKQASTVTFSFQRQ